MMAVWKDNYQPGDQEQSLEIHIYILLILFFLTELSSVKPIQTFQKYKNKISGFSRLRTISINSLCG